MVAEFKTQLVMIAALLVLSLSGCMHESLDDTSKGIKTIESIHTEIEESGITKALFNNGTVSWKRGVDKVGVFSDIQDVEEYEQNLSYYVSGDGSKEYIGGDIFRGKKVSGNQFYAFFPYSSSGFQPEDRMRLKFYQSGVVNTSYYSLPMVAKSDGDVFTFHQTMGIFHFSIMGVGKLNKVIFRGNSEEQISGYGFVDLSEDKPVFRFDESNGSLRKYDSEATFPEGGNTLDKEKGLDMYFAIPEGVFHQGVSIEIVYTDEAGATKQLLKSTHREIQSKCGIMKNFVPVDLDDLMQELREEQATEIEILMDFYQALDGNNWTHKDNWGSDKPVSEWYGVTTNGAGLVSKLDLEKNGLSGVIPASFSGLSCLEWLNLSINSVTGVADGFLPMPSLRGLGMRENPLKEIPVVILQGGLLHSLDLSSSDNGEIGEAKPNNPSYTVIPKELYEISTLESLSLGHPDISMPIPEDIGKLKNLHNLHLVGFSGSIPESFYDLDIEQFYVRSDKLDGSISSRIRNWKNLSILDIGNMWNNKSVKMPLSGTLPDELYECARLGYLSIRDTHISGSISSKVGSLTNLRNLYLTNDDLEGPLPVELTNLDLRGGAGATPETTCFMLSGNPGLSGKVPSAFRTWRPWRQDWGYVVPGTSLDMSEALPDYPILSGEYLNGGTFSSEEILNHELTALFQWTTWCDALPTFLPILREAYENYHKKGFEVYGYAYQEKSTLSAFLQETVMPWKTFIYNGYYPNAAFPSITLFDGDGKMVFTDYLSDMYSLPSFLESWFAEEGPYASTDFSSDGIVHQLQVATQGNGIDVVLMGDAYSDRLIADGTYAARMQMMATALFSEEPYKSFQDYFNVFYVDVVSKNEVYYGETALNTWYGEGTLVGGDNAKVYEYARKALPDSKMDDAMILVAMNRDRYAGTCYMNILGDGDYGRGSSISYCPTSSDAPVFRGMVSHEAGGHGFAKLEDEYVSAGNGAVTEEAKAEVQKRVPYGYGKNVDFTKDPATVKWSKFLADSRYVYDGLGCFEGGITYATGVWRPTQNSIMNHNTDGYNAPSREAIYYRIHKLAFGPDWEYNYEDFVAYDAINRKQPSASAQAEARHRSFVEKKLPPLAPPVIIEGSWRDSLR